MIERSHCCEALQDPGITMKVMQGHAKICSHGKQLGMVENLLASHRGLRSIGCMIYVHSILCCKQHQSSSAISNMHMSILSKYSSCWHTLFITRIILVLKLCIDTLVSEISPQGWQ